MASNYQKMHDQFSAATPPDPQTFVKMIWGILTPHQQDLVKALLTNPQMGVATPQPGAAAPAGAPAANPGVPQPGM